MNLFWKKLFGGITPTAKLERKEAEILNSLLRYDEVEKSVELAEYKQLYHIVKSASFIENKKLLKNRKYKDTEEFQIWKKYNKFKNSNSIRVYYEVLKSNELESFEKFKLTPEYESLGDKKKVKVSKDLQTLKHFERSKTYKTYVRFHNSYIIEEYEKIKVKIESPEFIKANEFWKNQDRWKTTPEFVQQQRFYELAKNLDIIFYENENPDRFKKYRSLVLTFEDEFDWNSLDKSNWNFGFQYKSPVLLKNHSFSNEKQANNFGKNTSVENGILKIHTKHEAVKAPAWDVKKGFVEQEFKYTSDVLQTADSYRQKQGVFRAKIRCEGNINHAFWLGTDTKLPLIKIFHYDGNNILVGNANESLFDGVKISGINPSEFFIYTLIWRENELIWMLNDLIVYRTSSNLPKTEMYLAFNSFISQKQKGKTGSIQVDWVRTYSN